MFSGRVRFSYNLGPFQVCYNWISFNQIFPHASTYAHLGILFHMYYPMNGNVWDAGTIQMQKLQ